MIDGVEILRQTEILTRVTPNWIRNMMYIFPILVFIFAIINTGITIKKGKLSCFAATIGFALIGLTILIILCVIFTKKVPTGRYRYEAIVENEAFREIYDKYDIIKTDDNLVIFEDKY